MNDKHMIKNILLISVTLNLLLVGLIAGYFYKNRPNAAPPMQASELSPEGRNIAARNFQAARNEMKDTFEKSREVRQDLIKILKANQFDEAAYDESVLVLKRAQGDMIDSKMKMLKNLARELPPEDRSKISERFIRPYGPDKSDNSSQTYLNKK